jgi:hypothetical protein
MDYTKLYESELNKQFANVKKLRAYRKDLIAIRKIRENKDPIPNNKKDLNELNILEEDWAAKYWNPIVEWFGTATIQMRIFNGERSPHVPLMIKPEGNPRKNNNQILNKLFTPIPGGASAHFTSIVSDQEWVKRKKDDPTHYPGENSIFNSYTQKYQIFGSNQFCQTFALMYVIGVIPFDGHPSVRIHPHFAIQNTYDTSIPISVYYHYAEVAVSFIEKMINKYAPKSGIVVIDRKRYNLKTCVEELKAHPLMCVNIPE